MRTNTAMTLIALSFSTLLVGCMAGRRDVAPVLDRVIALPGVNGTRPDVGVPGRLDHLAYDPVTDRLFVAALENNSLEVIDLTAGQRVKSIPGLAHPQGIAVVPETHRVAVACGHDGLVHVYDTESLAEINSISVGRGADNVRYDAQANTIYVTHGNKTGGALTVIDADSWRILREIPFRSRPESFQLEPDGKRIFANLPGGLRAIKDGVVAIVDRETGQTLAEIPLQDHARNYPMAFDAERERLFTVSRRPASLIHIDTQAQKVVAEAECTDDSDDLFYDAKTDRILVVCGGYRPDFDDPGVVRATPPPSEMGTIDVFKITAAGELKKVAETPTARHARTGYFVPAHRAVYVAVPQQDGRDAEIREFKIGG